MDDSQASLMAYLQGLQANSGQPPAQPYTGMTMPNYPMPGYPMPQAQQQQPQQQQRMAAGRSAPMQQPMRAQQPPNMAAQRQAGLANARMNPEAAVSMYSNPPAQQQQQPGGQGDAQLAQLMAFMQSQSQTQSAPTQPQRSQPAPQMSYPGLPQPQQQQQQYAMSQAQAQQGLYGQPQRPPQQSQQGSSSMLMGYGGAPSATPEQAQMLARLSQQRRAAAPQGVQQSPVPSQQSLGVGYPSAGLIPSQGPPIAPSLPIAIFLRNQQQLRGLQNRIRTIEGAIREKQVLNLGGKEPLSKVYDQRTDQLYKNQLVADKAAADQLNLSISTYVKANGGQEVVAAQAQAFLKQQQQNAQAPLPQPYTQPPPPQSQQQTPNMAARTLAPAAGPSNTSSPMMQQMRMPQAIKTTPEQIASMFQSAGLAAQAFERAFAELRSKRRVPTLDAPPVINGREINLYDLVRQVLSSGGSDHFDATGKWGPLSKQLGLFDGVVDSNVARDIVGQLQALYRTYAKPFEEIWISTIARRQADQQQPPAPANRFGPHHQEGQGGQQSYDQAAMWVNQQHQQQQQQASMSQPSVLQQAQQSRAPTPLAGALPQPTVGPSQPFTLPKPSRAPTPEEIQVANQQIKQLSEAVMEERRNFPLTQVNNLSQAQKNEIKQVAMLTVQLVKNLRQLLPTYLCLAGQQGLSTVKRYLSLVFHFHEQFQALESDVFYFQPEQIKFIRETSQNCLLQIAAAMKDLPNARAAAAAAAAQQSQAQQPVVPASETDLNAMKTGLRREDLKPPPTKRARTSSYTEAPVVADTASPGKLVSTPEATGSPRPGPSTPSSRGRTQSARGTVRGRGRGTSTGGSHSRTASTSSIPTPLVQSTPAPIDPAEQRRLDEEVAKANPAQYTMDAFARWQEVQAQGSWSYGAVAEDIGARLDPSGTALSIAPVAANPPPMPTLSSLAPGWPVSSSMPLVPVQSNDDDTAFDYSSFLNLDEEGAATPELHENASNDSPPDDAVVTPKHNSEKLGDKRKRESDGTTSPQPIVPELGSGWNWDQLIPDTDPTWQALAF